MEQLMPKADPERYSKAEAKARFEAALRGSFSSSPKAIKGGKAEGGRRKKKTRR
jgi:hypothetical protein